MNDARARAPHRCLARSAARRRRRDAGSAVPFETGAKGFAVDELGDDERGALLVAELVNRQDVGMGELRDAQRFSFEPRPRVRSSGQQRRQAP